MDEQIDARYKDLIAYQNVSYADRYRALVNRVREAEAASTPGRTGFAAAVARYFYKLMAYKDEYEVARLYTNGDWLDSIKLQFQDFKQIRFHMAPPLISRRNKETGELEKREFGFWMYRALQLAAKMKFLRGTWLDVFGKSAERREERKLIDEYEKTISDLCNELDHENYELAVQIAAIPEQIRGYGHVKHESMQTAATKRSQLMESFHSSAPGKRAA